MLIKCPISQKRVSKSAARLASLFNILILTYFFIYNEPIALYLLSIDFAIKSFDPSKSPLSRLALFIIKLFHINLHFVDALPKQFALRLGFSVLLLSSIVYMLGYILVAKVFIVLFLVLTFLEFSIGFCAGCYMFTFYLASMGGDENKSDKII